MPSDSALRTLNDICGNRFELHDGNINICGNQTLHTGSSRVTNNIRDNSFELFNTNVNLCHNQTVHAGSESSKEDGWEVPFSYAQSYDKNMCSSWRRDIKDSVIPACLLSIVLSVFIVGSGQLRLDGQLQNTTSTSGSQDSAVTFAAFRVNTIWLISLSMSLTTLLIGSLCHQWLHEYQSIPSFPSKAAFELRQVRYEGLIGWRVHTIIMFLPTLLQISVILFFVGLLDLLWSFQPNAAIALSVPIGISIIFLLATTVLPALTHQQSARHPCAYKSPQSFAFYQYLHFIAQHGTTLWNMLGSRWRFFPLAKPSAAPARDWASYDIQSLYLGNNYLALGLLWLNSTKPGDASIVDSTQRCLKDMCSGFFSGASPSSIPGEAVSKIISHFRAEASEGKIYLSPFLLTMSSALCDSGLYFSSYSSLFAFMSPNTSLATLYQCFEEIARLPEEAPPQVLELLVEITSRIPDPPLDVTEGVVKSFKSLLLYNRIKPDKDLWKTLDMLRLDSWGADLSPGRHIELAFMMIDEIDKWFRSHPKPSYPYATSCVQGILAHWWTLDDIPVTAEMRSTKHYQTLASLMVTLQHSMLDSTIGLNNIQQNHWDRILEKFQLELGHHDDHRPELPQLPLWGRELFQVESRSDLSLPTDSDHGTPAKGEKGKSKLS